MNLTHNRKNAFPVVLFIFITLTLFKACSPTQETATDEGEAEPTGPYQPEWYSENPFQSDSLGYVSTATAISDDSLKAAEAAKKQSIEFLKQGVAEEMEDQRKELEQEEGNAFVGYKEFIILLRKAEGRIGEFAEVDKVEVIGNAGSGNAYRGFARVSFNYEQLDAWLKASFRSNSSYYNRFVKHVK